MSFEFGLTEKWKMQAVFLLITLIGLLFSIIPIKYDTPFSIFIPGIVLLVIPVVYLLVWTNGTITRRDEIFMLALIMLTIFFNHYIFALRFNYPIGSDASSTLSMTQSFLSDIGKIEFTKMRHVAYGFPGLYILYTVLQDITGKNLYFLATYLPPAINMVVFIFFYFFIRRFFEPRLSLLAVFLCGWEFVVIKFGFEYRTQGFAIVLYMLCLALIAFSTRSIKSVDEVYTNETPYESYKHNRSEILVCILILVAGTLIVHLVTSWVLLLTFLTIYGSYIIAHSLGWRDDLKISTTLLMLSFILFIAYMMYVAHFFDTVIDFARWSLTESFSSEALGPTSKMEGVVADLYGPFIFWVTWLTRIVFIGSTIIFIQKSMRKKKRVSDLFILGWAGVLLLFIVFISVVGYELNPGRLYNFFAFPFSIIVSFGLIYAVRTRVRPKCSIKLIVTIFLILFVITSLLKFPNSIIGDTEPFRGYQSVDNSSWARVVNYEPRTNNAIASSENVFVDGG